MASFYGELVVRITSDTSGLSRGFTESTAKTQAWGTNAAKAATNVARKFERVGLAMQNAGRTMTQFVTLPVAAGFAYATYSAYKYEQELLKVKNLTGLTAEQTKLYGEEVLKLSQATGVGPQKLAEAFYFIASSGFEAKEAIDALEISAKASAAGLGDVQVTANVVTSAVNAYGHSNLTAAHAVDVLMRTIEVGKAEPEALATSLGRIMPIAKNLGVPIEDLGGMVAGLTLTGLSAAEAVTSLRGTMIALVAPAKMSMDELAKIGLTYKDVTASIKDKGLLPTLQMLYERVDGNRLAMRKLIPNVRALNGVLSLLGPNYRKNLEVIAKVNDAQGKLNETFNNAQKTASQKLKKALATIQAQFIQIGAIILPFVADLAVWLGDLMKKFEGLSESTQKSILKFLAIAALAGPVLMFFGGVTRSIGLLGTAMAGMLTFLPRLVQTIMAVATAFRVAGSAAAASTLTAAFGPAGWVALGIAAVAALTVGVYALWKALDQRVPERTAEEFQKLVDVLDRDVTGRIQRWADKALGGHYVVQNGELIWEPAFEINLPKVKMTHAFENAVREQAKQAEKMLEDQKAIATERVKDIERMIQSAYDEIQDLEMQKRVFEVEWGVAFEGSPEQAYFTQAMEGQKLYIDHLKGILGDANGVLGGFANRADQMASKFADKLALAQIADVRTNIRRLKGDLKEMGKPTTVKMAMREAEIVNRLQKLRDRLKGLTDQHWPIIIEARIKKAQTEVDTIETALRRVRRGGVTKAEVDVRDKLTAKLKTMNDKLAALEEQERKITVSVDDKFSEEVKTLHDSAQIWLDSNPLTQVIVIKKKGSIEDGNHSGGILSGPHSGYPALLHGREAILPLDHPNLIPGILAQAGITVSGGSSVTASSRPTVETGTPVVASPPQNVTIPVYLDGKLIAEHVVKINGDEMRRKARKQGMVV